MTIVEKRSLALVLKPWSGSAKPGKDVSPVCMVIETSDLVGVWICQFLSMGFLVVLGHLAVSCPEFKPREDLVIDLYISVPEVK